MANNNVNGSIGRSDEFCRISKSYGNKYETSIDRDSIDKLLNVKYKYTMVEISKNAVIREAKGGYHTEMVQRGI
jgi:hypothetical protein